MKRHRLLYLGAGLSLLAGMLLATGRAPKEPVYQGKALTQWIREAHDVGIFEQTDETNAAMLAMGTNAVPFLLKEFSRPISRWRERLYAWVNSHAGVHVRTDEERVRLAGQGLMLLGTNAAPALPVLVRYQHDPIRRAFVADILSNQNR